MSNCPDYGETTANGKECTKVGTSETGKKKLLIPLAIVLVGLTAVFCGMSFMRSELELKKYIAIDGVDGLDGQGILQYAIDADALAADLFDDEQPERTGDEEFLAEEFAKYEELCDILDCITLTASAEDGLSNGDTVTVSASFENAGNDSLDYRFKDGSVQYTVSGLAEGKIVDPFDEDAVSVVFSGFSGTGAAYVEVLSEDAAYEVMDYALSQEEGLCNGEVITLSVAYSAERLAELGYFAPEKTEADYTVSGLEEYFKLEDGFPAGMLEDLRVSAIENAYTALAENHNTDYTLALEPEVTGMYYMEVSDRKEPFSDRFYGLEMINGVAVLSHAITGNYEFYSNTWHEWYIDVYPDFYWDASGELSYHQDGVVTYSVYADTVEEAYSLLEEKFGELDIVQLDQYQ